MGKRSNLIVTIGLAVFVIGAGATFFVVRNGGGDDTKIASGAGQPPFSTPTSPSHREPPATRR